MNNKQSETTKKLTPEEYEDQFMFSPSFLWIGLWVFSIPSWAFLITSEQAWIFWLIILSALIVIWSFWHVGHRYSGGLWHFATLRKSRIMPALHNENKSFKKTLNLFSSVVLFLVWLTSACIAASYNSEIDPDWVLIVPGGFFLGGAIFVFFLMIDNFKKVISNPNFILLFIVVTFVVFGITMLNSNTKFSSYWNLWFLVVSYIYQRICFGANRLK